MKLVEKQLRVFAKCMVRTIPELRRCEISIGSDNEFATFIFDCDDKDVFNKLVYEYGMYLDANVITYFSNTNGHISALIPIPLFLAYNFGFYLGQLSQ